MAENMPKRRERERVKKEKWGKPKLIILTRGKPEEGLLANCKGITPSGPKPDYGNCMILGVGCITCLAVSSS